MFQSGKVWFAWWGAVLRKMSEYVDFVGQILKLLSSGPKKRSKSSSVARRWVSAVEVWEHASLRDPHSCPVLPLNPVIIPLLGPNFVIIWNYVVGSQKKVVTLCVPGQLCNSSSLCLHRLQQSSDSSKKQIDQPTPIISLSKLNPVVHCCSNWSGRAQRLSSSQLFFSFSMLKWSAHAR